MRHGGTAPGPGGDPAGPPAHPPRCPDPRRDLKLENVLLDSSSDELAKIKIADFGYSKSSVMQSAPNSTVGTPAYVAPEVLLRPEYEGQPADVWSAGVTLYVMLCGKYPFEDPRDPKNFQKTLQRIINVEYHIPSSVELSSSCLDMLQRMLIPDPEARITIPEIFNHAFFKKDLPAELVAEVRGKSKKPGLFARLKAKFGKKNGNEKAAAEATSVATEEEAPLERQSTEEIAAIIKEATTVPVADVDMRDDDFDDDFDNA